MTARFVRLDRELNGLVVVFPADEPHSGCSVGAAAITRGDLAGNHGRGRARAAAVHLLPARASPNPRPNANALSTRCGLGLLGLHQPSTRDSSLIAGDRERVPICPCALSALEGARRVSLDVLPTEDGVALFTAVAGEARTSGEQETVLLAGELCGHLPLRDHRGEDERRQAVDRFLDHLNRLEGRAAAPGR